MRFEYFVSHVPQKEIDSVDTLSRALVRVVDGRDDNFHKQVSNPRSTG